MVILAIMATAQQLTWVEETYGNTTKAALQAASESNPALPVKSHLAEIMRTRFSQQLSKVRSLAQMGCTSQGKLDPERYPSVVVDD